MSNELKIVEIDKGSVGEDLNLKPNDIIIGFNGKEVEDMLDYSYYDCMENFVINIRRGDSFIDFEVEKEEWEQLGLTFSDECYLTPKNCKNKCIFCFVDQLPPNMRETLYVKDDDYRLSFVSGNYVTLTNVNEHDIERIINMKFSPLYVSVHATDEEVRLKMLGIKRAIPIMSLLKRLTEAGIMINTQIVVCPTINDGEVLDKSLNELFELYPLVRSVAIVPVGLTGHRKKLTELRQNTKEEARTLIRKVDEFNNRINIEDKFAMCSDEVYVIAGMREPPYEYYGDFEQIENGVGLLAKFRREFEEAIKYAVRLKKGSFSILTGVSAYWFMCEIVEMLKTKFPTADIEVIEIVNKYFGESVTVTGLITGKDIIEELKNRDLKECVLIPRVMLKEFENVFLDGNDVGSVQKALNRKIIVTDVDGYALAEVLTDME